MHKIDSFSTNIDWVRILNDKSYKSVSFSFPSLSSLIMFTQLTTKRELAGLVNELLLISN